MINGFQSINQNQETAFCYRTAKPSFGSKERDTAIWEVANIGGLLTRFSQKVVLLVHETSPVPFPCFRHTDCGKYTDLSPRVQGKNPHGPDDIFLGTVSISTTDRLGIHPL